MFPIFHCIEIQTSYEFSPFIIVTWNQKEDKEEDRGGHLSYEDRPCEAEKSEKMIMINEQKRNKSGLV